MNILPQKFYRSIAAIWTAAGCEEIEEALNLASFGAPEALEFYIQSVIENSCYMLHVDYIETEERIYNGADETRVIWHENGTIIAKSYSQYIIYKYVDFQQLIEEVTTRGIIEVFGGVYPPLESFIWELSKVYRLAMTEY